jgi:hypothetical protein
MPIDGFFEWKAVKGENVKQPFAIAMKDGSPFGLGALWENWKDPGHLIGAKEPFHTLNRTSQRFELESLLREVGAMSNPRLFVRIIEDRNKRLSRHLR